MPASTHEQSTLTNELGRSTKKYSFKLTLLCLSCLVVFTCTSPHLRKPEGSIDPSNPRIFVWLANWRIAWMEQNYSHNLYIQETKSAWSGRCLSWRCGTFHWNIFVNFFAKQRPVKTAFRHKWPSRIPTTKNRGETIFQSFNDGFGYF